MSCKLTHKKTIGKMLDGFSRDDYQFLFRLPCYLNSFPKSPVTAPSGFPEDSVFFAEVPVFLPVEGFFAVDDVFFAPEVFFAVDVFFPEPDGFSSFSSFEVLVDTRLIRPEVSFPRSTAPKSEVSMPRFKPPATPEEALPEEELLELLEEPPPREPSNIGAAALRMLDVALWLTPLACATCCVVVWLPFARSMGNADVKTLVTSFFEAFVFLLTCFTVSSVIRPDNKAEISIYHRLLFQVRIYLPSLSPECPKKSINFALFH